MTRKRWLELYDHLWEVEHHGAIEDLYKWLRLLLIELKPELGQKIEDIHRDNI